MRLSTYAILLTVAALGIGCRSHSLREGKWILKIDGRDHVSQQAFKVPDQEIELTIDWSDGSVEEHTEVVELRNASTGLVMFGDVHKDGKKVQIPKGTDSFWVFRLYGQIVDDSTISGTTFYARHRHEENTAIEGRWQLLRVEEQ
ncbi:MAG: hypothetical protein AAF488_18920 [Planctomycetota bacterium]